MKKRLVAWLALAFTVPVPGAGSSRARPAAPVAVSVPTPAPGDPSPTRVALPSETWSSSSDARALAADDAFVWVATGGGLDRYTRATREHRHYGTADGLDTLDVRGVDVTPAGIVAHTASGRCMLGPVEDRFACTPARPAPARAADLHLFRDHPVTARLTVGADIFVATRGGGAFFVPGGNVSKAQPLGGGTEAPPSFVHTAAVFGGSLWLGTFEHGLFRAPLDARGHLSGSLASTARAVASPARLVNRLVATTGPRAALFVGTSDGLFVSRDGVRFSRVRAIGARTITGLSVTPNHLWITSSEALYRLPATGDGPVERSFVYPGGSHAVQAVAASDEDVAWLATEDRGVVRVDARANPDASVRVQDRLAGLPTSWFLAIDLDGHGGAIATSLRHGAFRFAADGAWSRVEWPPSPWGLAVRRDEKSTCVGTQGGAACEVGGLTASLGALPDPRVHLFFRVGDAMLVGTEAGAALYAL